MPQHYQARIGRIKSFLHIDQPVTHSASKGTITFKTYAKNYNAPQSVLEQLKPLVSTHYAVQHHGLGPEELSIALKFLTNERRVIVKYSPKSEKAKEIAGHIIDAVRHHDIVVTEK